MVGNVWAVPEPLGPIRYPWSWRDVQDVLTCWRCVTATSFLFLSLLRPTFPLVASGSIVELASAAQT